MHNMFFKLLKSSYPRRLIKLNRQLSTQSSSKQYTEVEIDVPWGKLTGKHWGPLDVKPIIALHGWQDNSNSFDPLAKNLPDNIALLAIDLPGHGYSSWIPKGIMYNTLIYAQTVHRVKEHYKMDQFGLIGHSLGGMVSFIYTSLFPKNVKFVVAFDYFKYPSFAEKHLPRFAKDWNNFFNFEKLTTPPPSYAEEVAIKRWIDASRNSLDESMCRTLMERGVTKKSDGTIFFRRDPRLKFFLTETGFSHEHLKILAKQIHSPYMIIKGENSQHNEPEEFYFDVLKVIVQNSMDFRFCTVPGTHHFHMSNAERVSQIMNPFISKYFD